MAENILSTRKQLIRILGAALVVLSACSEGEDRDAGAATPVDRTARVAEQPVMIGYDGARFAACGRVGRVVDLPFGEDSLVVRAAPAESAAETDRLPEGSRAAMCQRTGGWIGIVYAEAVPADTPEIETEGEDSAQTQTPSGDLRSCGTGSPVTSVRAYEGPCRTGWVSENYMRLVSGRI